MSANPWRIPEQVRTGFACIAAIVSTGVTVYLLWLGRPYFDMVSDLPEYILAGKLVVQGKGADLYKAEAVMPQRKAMFPTLRERDIGIISPPPALPLFAPLGFLPVDVTKMIWQPVLFAAAVASMAILAKTFKLSSKEIAWTWAVVAFLDPFYESLRIDQISCLLLLVLCAATYFLKQGKELPAGALLALFILKPQELITFGFFLLGASRFKVIAYALGTLALLAVLALLLTGMAGYLDYFALMRNIQQFASTLQVEITPTVRGQLTRLGLPAGVVSVVSAVSLLCACGFSMYWGRLVGKSKYWVEAGLVVTMPIGILTAYLAHFYDLIMLIPGMVAMAKSPFALKMPEYMTILGIVMLMSFMIPVGIPIHYGWLMQGVRVNPFFWVLLVVSVFICVYAITHKSNWLETEASPEVENTSQL